MPAKDYKIAINPETNAVCICEASEKDLARMSGDKARINKRDFILLMLEWVNNEIGNCKYKDTLHIRDNGKIIAEIRIDREALGFKQSSDPDAQECDATTAQ